MPTTQVILTRHAEKEAGDDPALTEVGRKRATYLGDMIKHMAHGLGAVYTSTARRTIETGDLAAQAAGATVTAVRESDAAAVARGISGRARQDEIILVVHHSESLAEVVRGLRPTATPPSIGAAEFDHLWCIALGDRQGEKFTRYPAAAGPSGGGGDAKSEAAQEQTWDEVKQQVIAAVEACAECRKRTNTLAMKFSLVQQVGWAGCARNMMFVLVGMAEYAAKGVANVFGDWDYVFKQFDIPDYLNPADPQVEQYICIGISNETTKTISEAAIPNIKVQTVARQDPIPHQATRIDWTRADGTVEKWVFDWHARLDVSNPVIKTLAEWKPNDSW